VEKREQLYCLFVLIDSRMKPQQIDLDFMDFLGEVGVPFAIVMTKTDKISQTELAKNLKMFKQKMSENWEALPEIFLTSSEKKRGREAMLQYIEQVLQS
jgi:GTP-binding protein